MGRAAALAEAAALFLAQAAIVVRATGNGTCVFSDVAYGAPSYGCCHFASAAVIICDPAGNGTQDAADAQQRCAELALATRRMETRSLSGWADCKALCSAEPLCNIWSFEPAERAPVSRKWQPATCTLVQENLQCSPRMCDKPGASMGQKDCGTDLVAGTLATAGGADRSAADATFKQQPLCDGTASQPPSVGNLVGSQMTFDAGCRYEVWDRPATANCLRGTWVIMVGGSNSILMTIQLANLLAPGTFHPTRTNAATFKSNVLDAVYENGVAIHSDDFQLLDNLDSDWSDNVAQFSSSLSGAPAHSAGRIRVTQFVGQYWDNVGHALEAVQAQASWAAADVVLVTQISQWYVGCAIYRIPYCNRRYLMGIGSQQLQTIFRRDMEAALDNKIIPFCTTRGAARGCTMLNNAYDPGQTSVMPYVNDLIKSVVATRASSRLRFVNGWALGEGAPQESMESHSSPIVMHWTWQVILAGVCSGKRANTGPFASFVGPTCFAGKTLSSYIQCPAYATSCGRTCHLWECSHSEHCAITSVNDSSQAAGAAVGTSCTSTPDVAVDWVKAATGAIWVSPCKRLVCEQSLEIVWPILSVLLAGLALLVRFQKCLVQRFFPEAEKTELKEAGDGQQEQGAGAEGGKEASEPPADKDNAVAPAEEAEAAEKPEGAKTPKERGASADRFPLGFARFLASLHIVCGHLQGRSAIADVYFFGWGFTWVPWFFMLSGFVLFSAELARPTQERILQYVARRSVTIYPLYAFSLLPSFFILKALGRAPDVGYLIAQVWLVQAWVPHLTEHVLQTHCWFLSCMVLYWVAFLPVGRVFKRFSLKATIASMLGLFFLPWLIVIVPAIACEFDWYKGHSTGDIDEQVDVWVIFLKFHPITYFHVFLLGMLLAKLRQQLEPFAQRLRWPMEAVMPLGYLVLILIMTIEPMRPWGHKLSMRLSIVLPLQAAIVLGFAGLPGAPQPLLAQAASKVEFLADYSYSVYIFQWICYYLWPTSGWVPFTFFIFLIATAVIMQIVVQLPAQYAWKRWPYARPAVPLLLCAILGGFSQIGSSTSATTTGAAGAAAALASEIVPAIGMRDYRLELTPGSDDGGVLMNTALFAQGNDVIVASRRHKLEYRQYAGQYNGSAATIVDQVYSSEIVLGKTTLAGVTSRAPIAISDWSGLEKPSGGAWTDLCVKETYVPSNNTVLRKVVTGPEDAKIFTHRGGYAITFNSLPPLGASGCAHPLGANQQMYLATGVNVDQPANSVVGRRIQCGFTRRDEKNWIPFHRNGLLYMVYSPHPHQVALVRDDGACEKPHVSNYAPFAKLLQGRPNLHIRGSGQAYVVEEQIRTKNLPVRHGLALFHVFDADTGLYAHFAYRFNPDPPFEIWQVSKQLPLQVAEIRPGGPAFAFVSGLLVDRGEVVISYSAGDREPRALHMTMQTFDGLFENCGVASDLYSVHGGLSMNFAGALDVCQREGKTLAIINSPEAQDAVWSIVQRIKKPIWIGLTEIGRPEGDWAWIDGSPSGYMNWWGYERTYNYQGIDEECGCMGMAYSGFPGIPLNGGWYSCRCSERLAFICER